MKRNILIVLALLVFGQVFSQGPTIFNPGDYKDGRKIVIFKDVDHAKSKEKTLQKIIKAWLKLVDQ